MQIPPNPPKFNIGNHVIPTNKSDRQEYPEGYAIELIALSSLGREGWIYWGMREERHVDG